MFNVLNLKSKGIALFELLVAQLLLGLFVFGFIQTQTHLIAAADSNKQAALAEMAAYEIVALVNNSPSLSELSAVLKPDAVEFNLSCVSTCVRTQVIEENLQTLQYWLSKEIEEFEFTFEFTPQQLLIGFAWQAASFSTSQLPDNCSHLESHYSHCLVFEWSLSHE